jgi:hypothetical protein
MASPTRASCLVLRTIGPPGDSKLASMRVRGASWGELGRAFGTLANVELHPLLADAAGDVAERFDLRA